MATSSSNFQFIFNNALKEYERKTKKDLLAHPLAAQLQACSSPTAILAVLQQQVQQLDQSQTTDDRLTRWLDPTINVLYAFSGTLGEGVGLVFSPAKAIFVGVGVLLSTAIDVRASRDTLADIFERMDNFFRRLSVYTEVPPTAEMTDINIKIMIEVLSILAIATKEIKQGRTKKYLKRLIGRTDIEDGLKRLDKLTEQEARMATAQVLKVMHTVDGKVGVVDDSVARVNDRVAGVDDRVRAVDNTVAQVIQDGKEANVVSQQTANDVDQMKRNQLRESLRKWLSPPDPSTNHNIAYGAHHKGTATWFFRGDIFEEWKSTGSLLWIHGKPGSGKTILCSTIIQDIEAMCEAKQVSISYFYFDFRDTGKQHLHDLVTSLLTQLSAGSSPRCDILSRLYSAHDSGARQPSDNVLTRSLKEMLTLPGQCPVYLIMDAIDECPNTSGIPSPRERVLQLIKDLINLHLPNFHICVTSRPEIDIRHSLEPLTSLRVSLHDQGGQKEDIANYVRSIVYSESEAIMRRWRTEDKELVIETLSERADGM
ncbi:NACHT domain-containing protein [Russula compacta]|nr:NACHT domain-containing protein [Russula compacta]